MSTQSKPPTIVLGITGSVAAYRAADLVGMLKDSGYGVQCVMTQRAKAFIGEATLHALSGNKVYSDLFDEETAIAHTELAEQARLVLIAPASANSIAKFAQGLCDDLLSCLFLVTRAPVVIAPAMNVFMWQHPAVQGNVALLKERGARFVGPIEGELACGYSGLGHIADNEAIVEAVRALVPIQGKSTPAGVA